MSILKKLLFIILCNASITSALASSWNYVAIGNDQNYYYFDAETIERGKDRTIFVWIKTVQASKPDTDGSWSTAYRWKFSCGNRTIQTTMWSTYDQNGNFLKSSSKSSEEQAVLPDSTGEAMLKIVCEPSFPNDKSSTRYFKLSNNDPLQATRKLVEIMQSHIDNAPK